MTIFQASIQIVELYVQVYSPITLSQLNLINPGTFNVPRHLEYNRIVFSRSPFIPPLERRGKLGSEGVTVRRCQKGKARGEERRVANKGPLKGHAPEEIIRERTQPLRKVKERLWLYPPMTHSRCMQKGYLLL